jgi:MoxR-like ATPase
VRVDYPAAEAELEILALARREAFQAQESEPSTHERQLSEASVLAARRDVLAVHLAPALERYLVELVLATRKPQRYGEDLERWIAFGASPRATIALDRCARANAWLEGRRYVTPEDIQALAPDVLRHRVLLNYEAEADGMDPDQIISILLDAVAVP